MLHMSIIELENYLNIFMFYMTPQQMSHVNFRYNKDQCKIS